MIYNGRKFGTELNINIDLYHNCGQHSSPKYAPRSSANPLPQATFFFFATRRRINILKRFCQMKCSNN